MIYKEKYEENGELKFKNEKIIDQNSLTSDCRSIQFNGLSACETCMYRNTEECGGGKTLIKMQNEILNK